MDTAHFSSVFSHYADDQPSAPVHPTQAQHHAELPHIMHKMGERFGEDFSSVSIGGGGQLAGSANAVAESEHIALGQGAPDVGSSSGQELLGQELAHIVQKRRGTPTPDTVDVAEGVVSPLSAAEPDEKHDTSRREHLEEEAVTAGARAAQGEQVDIQAGSKPPLRQFDDPKKSWKQKVQERAPEGKGDAYLGYMDDASDRMRKHGYTHASGNLIAAVIDNEAGKHHGRWKEDSYNKDSHAAGLTQFVPGTWQKSIADKRGTFVHDKIAAEGITDKSAILNLRNDPESSIHSSIDYAMQNLDGLKSKISKIEGKNVSELDEKTLFKYIYISHHEGPGGAAKFLDLMSGQELDEAGADKKFLSRKKWLSNMPTSARADYLRRAGYSEQDLPKESQERCQAIDEQIAGYSSELQDATLGKKERKAIKNKLKAAQAQRDSTFADYANVDVDAAHRNKFNKAYQLFYSDYITRSQKRWFKDGETGAGAETGSQVGLGNMSAGLGAVGAQMGKAGAGLGKVGAGLSAKEHDGAPPNNGSSLDIHLQVPWYSQFDKTGKVERPGNAACFRASSAMARDAKGVDGKGCGVRDLGFGQAIRVAKTEDKTGKINVDPAQARLGLAYINQQLETGKPIVVGVSYKVQTDPRKMNQDNGITDHFVVIDGREVDPKTGRTYYTFLDPRTKQRTDNSQGRFYVDDDGKMVQESGTQTKQSHNPYEVSMVRRSGTGKMPSASKVAVEKLYPQDYKEKVPTGGQRDPQVSAPEEAIGINDYLDVSAKIEAYYRKQASKSGKPYNPETTVSGMRALYGYDGSSANGYGQKILWEQMIPDAPDVAAPTAKDVPELSVLFHKGQGGGSQPRLVRLPNGDLIDPGHLYTGIDAAQHPQAGIMMRSFGIQNQDGATWSGDVGQAIVKHENNPGLTAKQAFSSEAGRPDLNADLDGIVLGHGFDKDRSLTEQLRSYYTDPEAKLSYKQRYSQFCKARGFGCTDGRLNDAAEDSVRQEVDHFTEAYGLLRSKPKQHEVEERAQPSLWPMLGPMGALYESYRQVSALQYAHNGHYEPQAPLSKEMTDQFIQYVNTGLAHEPR